MNKYNSSSILSYSTCLPPEAYLRIIKSCGTDTPPKFKSTVYPIKHKQIKTKTILQKQLKKQISGQ